MASADFVKALEVAQQALELTKDLGDSAKEGLMLCVLSQLHTLKGEAETGAQLARDALAELQKAGSAVPQLSAFDALATALAKQGQTQNATTTLQRAQEDLAAAGQEKERAQVFLRMAELHLSNYEPSQGLVVAGEAAAIMEKLGDKAGIARAMLLRAELYASQGDNQKAAKQASATMDACKELGRKGLAGYLASVRVLVGVRVSDCQYEVALDRAKAALKYFNELREKKFEASILMTIADIQLKSGNASSALTTLQQVPALSLAAGDKRGEAEAWMRIAELHFDQKEPDLALHAAEEAKMAYRTIGDKAGGAAACQIITEANFTLVPSGYGSASKCLSAAQEVVEVSQTKADKSAEAAALNNLANAQLMSRKFDEALKTAFQAEELFEELSDKHGQASARLLSSGANLGEGKFAEATSAAKEARDLFKLIGDTFGEDSTEEFMELIDSYQSGQRSRADFVGFSVSGPDEAVKPKRARTRPRDPQVSLDIQNIDSFGLGRHGKPQCIASFEHYETRSARPAKAPSKAEEPFVRSRATADPGSAQPGKPAKREQVLYTIRWVRTGGPQQEDLPDLANKTVARSGMFAHPSKDVGRSGPSERMFHGFGGDRGI